RASYRLCRSRLRSPTRSSTRPARVSATCPSLRSVCSRRSRQRRPRSAMTIPRAGFLLALLLLAAPPARAAAPLTRVVMTTGSFAEREGVVYVAQDQGFFRKYSIDLSFVQVRSGPVGMSALAAGESQFHWGSVTAANLGAIAEGADIVFIAGFINKLT